VRHEKVIGIQRTRRRFRVRNALKKHTTRPRLSVFRSRQHMYAQIIDDQAGKTLASASTLDHEVREAVTYGGNKVAAAAVGKAIAQRALAAGVKQAAFDRREYRYHGRVAALADAARDAGLDLGAKPPPPEPEPEKKEAKGKKEPKQPKQPKQPKPKKEKAET
jgi:large subunit ribosomal protein L18